MTDRPPAIYDFAAIGEARKTDPIAAPKAQGNSAYLWREYLQLEDRINADAGGEADAFFDAIYARMEEIEDAIVGGVMRDKAGLIAQMRLLIHRQDGLAWDEFSVDLCRKVIAGIATLTTS